MEAETHRGYYTTEEETANKSKKIAWFTFWDNDFADKVELDLNGRELIQENGKWFVVKKKPKYPTTFEECLNLLYCKSILRPIIGHKAELLLNLEKLLICRDAYWKIAGEQMGLGKSWDSTYGSGEWGYWFGYDINENKIYLQDSRILVNHTLVFPTEEMRDAFYENFKDLIEQCKELL